MIKRTVILTLAVLLVGAAILVSVARCAPRKTPEPMTVNGTVVETGEGGRLLIDLSNGAERALALVFLTVPVPFSNATNPKQNYRAAKAWVTLEEVCPVGSRVTLTEVGVLRGLGLRANVWCLGGDPALILKATNLTDKPLTKQEQPQ